MSNKEELAKQYASHIPSGLYKILENDIDRMQWISEIENAFKTGWDAAFKETINYLEILMERNSLPLGLQKAIVKELKHFIKE